MDFVGAYPVDGGFRVAKPLKHRLCAFACRRRQRRPIDQRENLGQRPMRMFVTVVALIRRSNVLI